MQVGDWVTWRSRGIGEIICFHSRYPDYAGVRFDKPNMDYHNLDGALDKREGYFVNKDELALIERVNTSVPNPGREW